MSKRVYSVLAAQKGLKHLERRQNGTDQCRSGNFCRGGQAEVGFSPRRGKIKTIRIEGTGEILRLQILFSWLAEKRLAWSDKEWVRLEKLDYTFDVCVKDDVGDWVHDRGGGLLRVTSLDRCVINLYPPNHPSNLQTSQVDGL